MKHIYFFLTFYKCYNPKALTFNPAKAQLKNVWSKTTSAGHSVKQTPNYQKATEMPANPLCPF